MSQTTQNTPTPQKAPKKRKSVFSRTPVVVALIGIIVALIGTAGIIIAASITARGSGPSPTPTPTGATATISSQAPTPQVLYRADFSKGDNGWLTSSSPAQWRYDSTNRVLTNNGKPPKANVYNLVAPYQPTTANYAVEAKIQVVSTPPAGSFFGIFVRCNAPGLKEYDAYILDNQAKIRIADEPNNSQVLRYEPYTLDLSWHTYRAEVKGNTITFFIDNQEVVQTSDNTYSEPGLIGLVDNSYQINISNFTVIPL